MRYLIWIPIEIIGYIIYTWLSLKNNALGGRWLWWMIGFSVICHPWVIASRLSKNLYFDGMLYDTIMVLTFLLTMWFLGQGRSFSMLNWAGVVLAVIAFILIKI